MYIFDGAMGTMLQAAGLEEGYCPELFNIERIFTHNTYNMVVMSLLPTHSVHVV